MNLIVAVDRNWAIGKDGDQLVYLSEDLKHFKALTTGHPVILGRKTLATFPGGRPLKGRRNMILSRSPGFAPEGAEVFQNLPALGGASVYAALLDKCGTAYVTRIEASFPGPDCFFPNLDRLPQWHVTDEGPTLEEQGLRFRYVTYRRT